MEFSRKTLFSKFSVWKWPSRKDYADQNSTKRQDSVIYYVDLATAIYANPPYALKELKTNSHFFN